jgi:predicted transcriptional regulator
MKELARKYLSSPDTFGFSTKEWIIIDLLLDYPKLTGKEIREYEEARLGRGTLYTILGRLLKSGALSKS